MCTVQGCGITTICIDGNFGLVRKQHSGVSSRGPSTVDSQFFMNDDEVETFVNSYENDKQTDQVTTYAGFHLTFTILLMCFLCFRMGMRSKPSSIYCRLLSKQFRSIQYLLHYFC
jgi:hypothetical protein